jgi:MFS-type transporter involved in bile tolerance (Atg22 family)
VLDGVIFNYFLIKHAEQHFFWIYVGTGLFYGIGFTIMCLKVKEGKYPLVEPISAEEAPGMMASIKLYFRECYSKPYYLWVFAGFVFGAMCFEPVHTFSIFFAKSLGMSVETYGKYLAASYVVSFVTSYIIGSLADRFHPLRMGIFSLAIYVPVTCLGAVFAINPGNFGIAFLIHMIVSGVYYASVASLGQRLYPKLKFAQFASAAFLLQSAVRAALPPVVGLVLDFSGHNYRLTFVASGTLAVVGLISMGVAYRQFLRQGGHSTYVAP